MNTSPDTVRPAGPPPTAEEPPSPPLPPWAGDGGGWRPDPPPPKRPVVTGVALVAIGALWLLHLLGVPLQLGYLLPGALVAIGLALLVGGRSAANAGLVTIGTVLAVVAVLVALYPGGTAGTAGNRTHTVTSLVDLEDSYELGAGELTIDLRELELPAGTTELAVRVGAGELNVLVPEEVTVVVDARVGLGEVTAFGTEVGGVAPQRLVTEGGDPGAGTLEVEARVGLGQVEVSR